MRFLCRLVGKSDHSRLRMSSMVPQRGTLLMFDQLYTLYFILYTLYCILYTLYFILYTLYREELFSDSSTFSQTRTFLRPGSNSRKAQKGDCRFSLSKRNHKLETQFFSTSTVRFLIEQCVLQQIGGKPAKNL